MCQKRMDGEEKVRILARRQENLTTKKNLQTYSEGKVICDGSVGCCP